MFSLIKRWLTVSKITTLAFTSMQTNYGFPQITVTAVLHGIFVVTVYQMSLIVPLVQHYAPVPELNNVILPTFQTQALLLYLLYLSKVIDC